MSFINELEQTKSDNQSAIDLLLEWIEWERMLIEDNAMWWPHVEKDKISGKTYDKMMELQIKRRTILELLLKQHKMKRHKWEKHRYNGKYSSFEIYARCINCGCIRKKQHMGVLYTMNGNETWNAPPCVLLNAEAQITVKKPDEQGLAAVAKQKL